jgi:hypothetical protein
MNYDGFLFLSGITWLCSQHSETKGNLTLIKNCAMEVFGIAI